mmetsp:Transcript_19414/g.23215  ORF Transcript_19414/g.23215 Transcript_19414/m.23215 type:complete len:182 (-) Transcript_19414:225-770(-)|eukprot:CAMPEP_0197860000 /NCGR_PEP_ID=MMETSP1438-20131217/35049_1 /TAXON_ID=1461541 /ORGANISM="Pterosperma sp., Strain CCMP1384" /LENGTH=181 /DNA_ID=CAMNT_0043476699 /DNA_START=220 /DNA_END=765 /DNA_ORIENTATION=+
MPDYEGYKVGKVLSVEPVAGKDKLKALTVDIGASDPVPVVTNAPNVNEGSYVVIATVGATVKDGSGEEIVIKKANVGGAPSEGMVCDCPMLGWSGGGSGTAALVPPSFAPGDTPPSSRPRMDGKGGGDEEAKPSKEPEPLFARKLTKEEKKAAAAAKKAAREAKKAGKTEGESAEAATEEE